MHRSLAALARAGAVAAASLVLASTGALAAERIALVIGNSAYKDAPLANPVNDAQDVAKALEGLGFKVVLKRNAGTREMRQAIREFGGELRRANVGLFYFAGHGVQVRGNNYLVPVGADIQAEADAEDLSIDASYVLRTMEDSQVKVSIVVLDACRNNPFARGFRSTSRGLGQMTAATGSLIAFATAPGSVAADGIGRNGTYTKHLLQSLRHTDSDILKVFQRVRAGVVKETGGKQTPWESTSLIGDFFFRSSQAPAEAPPPQLASPASASELARVELTYWQTVRESRNALDHLAYLDRYPQGEFATLAKSFVQREREELDALIASTHSAGTPASMRKTRSGLSRTFRNSAERLKATGNADKMRLLFKLYELEAAAGDPGAQFSLGSMYRHGVGVDVDHAESRKWIRRAAEAGDPAAQHDVAFDAMRGDGMPKDEAEAVRWYLKAAAQGLSASQFNLGLAYRNGRGVDKDDAIAASWFRKAADQGHSGAQDSLAYAYLMGRGVAKDEAEAAKWYRAAAEQGLASAQNSLGAQIAKGEGVRKDDVEALKWYRKAADQGYATAQANIGYFYILGRGGLPKDPVEAIKWLRPPAEKGYAPAQATLGLHYELGQGVAKDQVEALKWSRKAVEQGNAFAHLNLGRAYLHGNGVAKDQNEAVRLFRIAAGKGELRAREELSKLGLE